MAVKFKKLVDGTQLGTTSSTLYTAPALTTTQIHDVTVCNTSTTAKTIDVYVVESGGSVSDTTTVIDGKTIGAKETVTLTDLIGVVLDPADTLRALASAATSVSIQASGVEIT